MRNLAKILLCGTLLGALPLLGACSKDSANTSAGTTAQIQSETARINDWFEARYQDSLAMSPLTQTYLGMKGCAK